MDQVKIGKFIKECRNDKKLTQQELADKLLISYKTVSKWECGNGLPEVSLMLPLCEILDISVNELLSGCHIENEHYIEKAEENLLNVLSERQTNKKKIVLAVLVAFIALLGGLSLVMLAGLLDIKTHIRIIMIVIALIIIFTGIIVCCFMDNDAGYFECKHCKSLFKPTMKAYIFGPHTLTRRQLKCPYCGKISYCKKRLSK